MAQFLGEVRGSRLPVTRLGSAKSGLTVTAASWNGAIEVELRQHDGHDQYRVVEKPWKGRGAYRVISDWRTFGAAEAANAA